MKRRTQLILILTALVSVAVVVVALGLWARGVADVARAGKVEAVAGARSLAAMDTTAAVSQFAAASRSFASARRSLGPAWIAGAVGAIPWAGHQYTTARALADIGVDASEAGADLADLLRAASSSETTGPASGFISELATRHIAVERALTSLVGAADRAAALRTDGLLPPLALEVGKAQAALRGSTRVLDRGRALIPLMTYLLSSDRRILVVSQNGAELRPTGGFAGTFGVVGIGPAGVRLEEYRDVYVLPDPPGRVKPPPGARMTNDFSFRDANWWMDFPTSARAMLVFWNAYGQPRVDGIIAIDTVTMRELLAVTGPITVPSIHETFTSENLLDRLLYLVELKPGAGKGVVVALAEELEKRMLGAGPGDLAEYSVALGKAADEKHIQMYFADPDAQAAADALRWSGRISVPPGVTDLLAVSNAMNKAGKVNAAMRKTIDYEVVLGSDRSADTTVVLGYGNTGPYPMPLPSIFRNWMRVYRAPTTVFPIGSPNGSMTVTTTEFGLPAEVRTFTLHRGQSRVETLTARVSRAIRIDSTEASGRVAYYRLRLVRQADLEDVPTTVTVTVSPGWSVTGASARFTASGILVPTIRDRDRVRLAVPLRGDLELEIRLAATP